VTGRLRLVLLPALAVLALSGTARAGSNLIVGVDDDQITWTARNQQVIGAVTSLRLDAMRVTLRWQPGRRNLTTLDHTILRRAVRAHRHGIRVVLSVYGRAVDAPGVSRTRETYCRFVRNVLQRYTEIRDVVIWNEANSPAFWRAQFDAPAAYEALLARCWDLLHASAPGVNVIWTSAAGHDPIDFLRAVGIAYRASGRTRPLFDTFGHNPYPLSSDESPLASHSVYVGEGDYDRLVAAIDGSFTGTAQPPPPIWYLEDGFQTAVDGVRRRLYAGSESALRTLSPATQALQLADALRLAYCQPRVTAFFNFLLVDEPTLPGWQSGLLWVNWRQKPSFAAYRAAIDEVHRGAVNCASVQVG